MRVLMLLDVLSSGGRGGAERAVLLLGRELSRRGVGVTTVLPTNEHTAGALAHFHDEGFDVESHPGMLSVDSKRRPVDVWRLSRLIAKSRPDLVSLHTGCSWLRMKDVLSVALAGRRCVATVHGAAPMESALFQRRTRRAAHLTSRIVVHGSAVKRRLVEAGVEPQRIEYVHCGVAAPSARPGRDEARARLGLRPDAFVISTLGRLIPRKGFGDLLQAFARLPDDGRTELLVGGDGPERAALEASVVGSLASRVKFLGLLLNPADLYAASDLFVMPARHEAFGLVFIEAAHYGVPSIGGADGGVADAIEHGTTGLLVEPGAIEELTTAIARLRADDALRLRLGAAAAERAERTFSVSAMADGYLRAFSHALH